MPKLSQAFGTKKISLPSYEGSEVILKTAATVQEIMDIQAITGDMEKSVQMAIKMIVSWNFDQEDGTPLPVNAESIKQLPTTDLEHLLEAIAPLIEKKNPSAKQ